MRYKEGKRPDLTFPGPPSVDHQSIFLGVLTQNAGQLAEVHRSLAALMAAWTANVMDSAFAMQRDVARLSLEAVGRADPVALMSIGQQAAQIGFRAGMDCAARNLDAATATGAQILAAVATPPGVQPGSPIPAAKEIQR